MSSRVMNLWMLLQETKYNLQRLQVASQVSIAMKCSRKLTLMKTNFWITAGYKCIQFEIWHGRVHHWFTLDCQIWLWSVMGWVQKPQKSKFSQICDFSPSRGNSIYQSSCNLAWKNASQVHSRMPDLTQIIEGVSMEALNGVTWCTNRLEIWHERAYHRLTVMCRISPKSMKQGGMGVPNIS